MTNGEPRGRLRLYLGAAPGVGKTYAMLAEGHRRAARDTDVVIGLVETHGRVHVIEMLEGLNSVPPVDGALDVENVLRRAPDVLLVDDLAGADSAGRNDTERWRDVEAILAAGIDVISTLNIAHLESLSDVVESITGVEQRHSIPDHVVRAADQIELIDMTPEALRRRLAHGNVFPADQVDAAVSQYFRPGNLAALRELALLWLADRVDEDLERYRHEHDIQSIWATRERVLVALTAGAESDLLLRRGARIATRGAGGELHAVYVSATDRATASPAELARLRVLTEELGGTHHLVVADDAALAVLQLARSLNATQIVVGVSRRSRWRGVLGAGVSERITAGADDIDVLVVSHPLAHRGRNRAGRDSVLGLPRTIAGWLLGCIGPVLLSLGFAPAADPQTLAMGAMTFLALPVACALVGGLWPALTAAVLGSLLLNWFFTHPRNTLMIADPVNVVALLLFLVVAISVASVVDKAARRSLQARQARREADTLTMLNHTLLRSDHDVAALLALVVETFSVQGASLLRRHDDGWEVVESVGVEPPTSPEEAAAHAAASPSLTLAVGPEPLPSTERRVLADFATHLAAGVERRGLADQAASAQRLEEGNRVRTALLAAVSHDLRTPLAGIKAAVSSLRSGEVQWSAEDQAELLTAIEESADRLNSIIANLLDLSRLQSNAVRPAVQEIGLDDVVSRAVAAMPQAKTVQLRLPADVPSVVADAGLLERVVANLLDNAVRYSPAESRVTVATSQAGDRVQLRVVDHGKGVPDDEKERMFAAFQRLGDTQRSDGIGLGLAVAKGLTEAVGGVLIAEDTPGGGLTMVIDLPVAPIVQRPPLSKAERR